MLLHICVFRYLNHSFRYSDIFLSISIYRNKKNLEPHRPNRSKLFLLVSYRYFKNLFAIYHCLYSYSVDSNPRAINSNRSIASTFCHRAVTHEHFSSSLYFISHSATNTSNCPTEYVISYPHSFMNCRSTSVFTLSSLSKLVLTIIRGSSFFSFVLSRSACSFSHE